MVVDSSPDLAPSFSKDFLHIQASVECGLTVKCVRHMIRRHSQVPHTGNHSEHSPIIWSVWPPGWVFFYELCGCGFESSCSGLNLRFCTSLEQEVPCYSGNSRLWIKCSEHISMIWSVWPNV